MFHAFMVLADKAGHQRFPIAANETEVISYYSGAIKLVADRIDAFAREVS